MRTVQGQETGISLWAAVLSNALPAFRAPQDDPAGGADPVDDNAGPRSDEGNGSVPARSVALKGTGQGRAGEQHQRAVLTDAQVLEMRRMREIGKKAYREIADAFCCSIWTARDICDYRTRAA